MRKIKIPVAIIIVQLLVLPVFAQKKNKDKADITIEEVAERCKGILNNDKVTIKVARFNVTTNSAPSGTFGQEMATMLTSAIQQTNCFRVLESNRNMRDMTDEMGVGQQGFTDGTGPEAGQLLGAQLIATGEVTEFARGSKGGTYGGIVTIGKNNATIGFIIKLLNPQTGDVLFSKMVNAKGEASAKASVLFGGFGSSSNEGDRAVSNAMEKGIIQAVQLMIDAKGNIEIPKPIKLEAPKKYNASNCTILQNGSGPKIAIIIPEAQVQGSTINRQGTDRRTQAEMDADERKADRQLTRDVIRDIFGNKNNNAGNGNNDDSKKSSSAIFKPIVVEQATAENEIIRRFNEAGFRIVDSKLAIKMRQKMDSLGGNDDNAQMAAAALKLGAHIFITGVALTEPVSNSNGMVSYRGTIELRAVSTEDATILASNTIYAGGVDVADAVAAKISLRNASITMANYMLEQLCNRNFSFKDAGVGTQKPSSGNPSAAGATEITISNITYSQMQSLETFLKSNPKIKGVKKTFASNAGKLAVAGSLSAEQIADLLSNFKTVITEIISLDETRIEAKVK
ncbi:MAG: hypothetical protein JNM14_04635 [Ferruginibacter sp.]|nr:hypothetical protein [Ferruginibacter sp.]